MIRHFSEFNIMIISSKHIHVTLFGRKNMDIMKIVNQTINLMLKPKETLSQLKNEKVDRNDIIIYLGVISIPTFLGIFLGSAVYGAFVLGVVRAIIFCIFAVIGVILFGYIFNELAPSFESKKNLMQSVKLVSYSSTPWLIAGILWLMPLPFVGFLSFLAGLYGLYILYLGLPSYMGTSEDQRLIYLIIGVVLMGGVMTITAFATRIIVSAIFIAAF
jgi:hypothetical protein